MEDLTILEFVKKVQNKEIDILEHTHKVLEQTKKINKEYNYFTTISEELALQQAKQLKKNPKGRLAGLPISVKDSICVKDVESTAGSRMLSGYYPPFNATVIENAIKQGAIIIGKTTQDEFGFGVFSTNTQKIPKNPFNKERTAGGSSGGCAGFTQKAEFPHLSIAESTGGSIAVPAAFCGVAGLTPTYGLVSRYGLIDYASSLDKIGAMAQDPEDAFILLNTIKGYDEKDSTSLKAKESNNKEVKKIAFVEETLDINKEFTNLIEKRIGNYDTVSIPSIKKYALPAYHIIAFSEASTNLAKFTGLRYGATEKIENYYNEYFPKIRSKYFEKETKRRIILGTFTRMAGFREDYYIKAMRVRTLIINEYQRALKDYDILISPTTLTTALKFSEIEKLTPLQQYQMDLLTVAPNLAGLPHLSMNIGSINQLPVGMMATANHLNEAKLLKFAQIVK
ncbi:MAG: amidase family protein [Candidatus Woesearchaeota archaeon]